MGLLFSTAAEQSTSAKSIPSLTLIRKLGCRACPLDKSAVNHSKLTAVGSDNPVIYILGESPDLMDSRRGTQFSGSTCDVIKSFIPDKLRSKVRWNNVVNCCSGDEGKAVEKIVIESCRPRIVADVEQTKPEVVIGLGPFALLWSDKPSGIELWRGRRFPIQIGTHACWFYPIQHPTFLANTKKYSNHKSDFEIAFEFDLKKVFQDIELGLPKPIVHTSEFAKKDITTITGRSSSDLAYITDFLEYAGTLDVVGIDYETQNLVPYYKDSVILTRAVSTGDETISFAWQHPQAGWDGNSFAKLEKAWVKFLKSEAKKAVQNLAFEQEWDCFFYGNELSRSVPWEDTQTQAYVLDERVGDHKPGALALEFIALQYFGINIKSLTPGLNKKRMIDEPLNKLLPYNGMDAKYHRLCWVEQWKRITNEGLLDVYYEKLRQIPTVVLTQLKGIPTNRAVTLKLEEEYTDKLKQIESAIEELPEAIQFRKLRGAKFNPGSSQDVIVILRDILKTREGQEGTGWSTKESILSKVGSPITKGVLKYRTAQKMKSTYIDPYMPGSPDLYDGDLLHPRFGTTFTETGRLNSSSPNIQNQPVRNSESKKIRAQVQSTIMASLDAGQIDARMIACGSRDKNYCRALWENYDLHLEWAKRLAMHHPDFIGGKKNLSDPAVMSKFRGGMVKNSWVFALFYGAALRTTAGRFKVDESVLKPLYEEFWKQFADVKAWQEKLVVQFEKYGYVQLLGGLRRRAPLGRGQIINSPVQGATNRIVMAGMNKLSETGIPVLQPNMQIHDSLEFCFNSVKEYEDNIERIIKTMLDCREFDWVIVPLVVELKDGPTWADLEPVGTFSSHKMLNWPTRNREFY